MDKDNEKEEIDLHQSQGNVRLRKGTKNDRDRVYVDYKSDKCVLLTIAPY